MTTAYRVLKKIGEGGMGEVFLAVQEPLGRQVALKFLFEEFSTPTQLERFEREIDASMRVKHPSVIEILDKGSQDDRRYYAMEFLDGWVTLHDAIREKGAFPWPRAAAIIAQVLDALVMCHGRQLIHRDIKPRNIMMDGNERAKLMDFGLVKDLDRTVLTAPGKILGTPSYIAPEVFRGEEVTPASDLFAVGAVLYELVTARRAFQGLDMPTIAMEVLESTPPALGTFSKELVPYQDLMDRFLEKDPAARFETAEDALEALRETTPSAVGIGFGPRPTRQLPVTGKNPRAMAAGEPTGPLSDTLVPGPGRARRLRRILAGLGVAGSIAVVAGAAALALKRAPAPASLAPATGLDLNELRVEAGADRLRFSVPRAPRVPVTIDVTEVTGSTYVSRAKARLTTSTWVAGLEPGKEYHYRLAGPEGGVILEKDLRTLTLPFAGARLVRAIETGDVVGNARRIRDRVINDAGLKTGAAQRSYPTNLSAMRGATERVALAEALEIFRPVKDAFYASPDVPWDLKRDLYIQLRALWDMEYLGKIRQIPVIPRTMGLESEHWGMSRTSALEASRSRSLVVAWHDVPEPAKLEIGEVVQVVPTGQKSGRWFSFPRNSFAENYFKELESENDRVTTIAYQSTEPLDFAFLRDARKLELVLEISRAPVRNWLMVSFGPTAKELREVAHIGSFQESDAATRTYHALDPRTIPPGPQFVRVETHYDEESYDWKQQFVELHWLAIRAEMSEKGD